MCNDSIRVDRRALDLPLLINYHPLYSAEIMLVRLCKAEASEARFSLFSQILPRGGGGTYIVPFSSTSWPR
jgi:hypothetical protein